MKDKFIEYCISKGDTFTDCVSFYNENLNSGIDGGDLLLVGFLGLIVGAALVASLID